jgi:hypothetical protein
MYLSFLDSQSGRSFFITFLQLLILQNSRALEVILSIAIFAMSIMGMLLGCGLPNDGVNSGKLPVATASPPSK